MTASSEKDSTMTVGEIIDKLVEAPNPFRWEAFDGSTAGPADAKYTVRILSPEGLSYIATSPGDVGFARAWVTGGMEVEGEHLAHPYGIFDTLRDLYGQFRKPSAGELLKIYAELRRMGALQIQPLPEVERSSFLERSLRQGLSRHSKERDADVISAHYDVGNEFYELFLGDTMTYTCAYYPSEDAGLDDAQINKYRLVFEKLRLKEGDRLLDIGCGWGGMARYAARRGVHVIAVTLSQEQAEWGRAAVEADGLGDLAEIRYQDYRDVPESDFDAVSSIGLLEHVGVKNYADYFEFLSGKLRPGGLMLNHCITYPDNHKTRKGEFIDRYIFPDGELTGSGTVVRKMQDHGFEVLHEENLRFDYMRTLRDWCENLKANWDRAVDLVGLPTAKLWGMYMAGSEWGFEHNVVQLHQVLGVKLDENGSRCGVPERMWWRP
ncbi:cyclopropane-fatty-acyl-phospholipid synthase [Corynebacterium frankenforstense DSM 45800]|uniref:Cyclopropane-fatty-acyl-phospholipid synthase n=1 Tax=Corynebacterium frankenforstense DSM 45800 TaxID=1437875 RepID=A0A1L7CR20_9CORY|nr:cyclopropane-fatty-acyl-phospholipid synthase family protein [Corynebacterium frankenforstense]APT88290.1 cyclopropane-fatty-acyl-phospholipid synthase [Corynebacterium frankenforstense DSM 45800]